MYYVQAMKLMHFYEMRDAKLNSVGEICIFLVVLENHSNVSCEGGALMPQP